MSDHDDFKAGDLVTRDGTDVHRVVKRDPGDNCMTVVCVQAPAASYDGTRWTEVGEEEYNLCRRYSYVSIDGEARRVDDTALLPPPSTGG